MSETEPSPLKRWNIAAPPVRKQRTKLDEQRPGPPMNANGPRRCEAVSEAGRCHDAADPVLHMIAGERPGSPRLHRTWATAPNGDEYLHVWEMTTGRQQ